MRRLMGGLLAGWLASALGCALLIGVDEGKDRPATNTGGGASHGGGGTGGSSVCKPNAVEGCYEGPAATKDVGACKSGKHTCNAEGSAWGECTGQVLPGKEDCAKAGDEDCDGVKCSEILWAKSLGDLGSETVQAVAVHEATGDIYLAGYFTSSIQLGPDPLVAVGGSDIFLARLGPDGSHRWSAAFGDVLNQHAHDLAVDASGNLFITGTSDGTVNFGGGDLPPGLFVAKLTSSGAHVWSKGCGGMPDQALPPASVAVTSQGDVVVAASFYGTVNCGSGPVTSVAGSNDILVTKLSAGNGASMWARQLGDGMEQVVGGVAVDSAGNVLVTGSNSGSIDVDGTTISGPERLFVVKLTTNGTYSWHRVFGDANPAQTTSITVDVDGGPLVAGYVTGSITLQAGTTITNTSGFLEGFVFKLGAGGAYVWSRGIGDVTPRVSLDGLGDVLVVGGLDGTGNFGGTPLVSQGSGHNDVSIAKLKGADGAHVWSKSYGGGIADQSALCVAGTATGEVVVGGYFYQSLNLETGPLTAPSDQEAFLLKLAP